MTPEASKNPPLQLSVIMPAYGEGRHLYANILRVCETLKDHRYEVIVVDDGSRDDTCSESRRTADAGYPVKTVRQEANRGKGATLFHGFEFASGELIAFLDADLEIGPENILGLWKMMEEQNVDVVAGVKDPAENKFPLLRRMMSGFYRRSVLFLFGLKISDTQTGIKLFRREVLEAAIPRMKTSRFAFDIELLVAASRFGYTIAEYPVRVAYRRSGRFGRMNLRHIMGSFIDTLTIYYRASFWRWLRPSLATQLLMILFVLGVFLFGVGVGKILTPLLPRPSLRYITHFLYLQFLPLRLRDWLLVIIGIALIVLTLIQLNKSLLKAFTRRDRGDLAGIFRK
jgi:glycosyltransferase involved in cell wall biosynthesis